MSGAADPCVPIFKSGLLYELGWKCPKKQGELRSRGGSGKEIELLMYGKIWAG